MLAALVLANIAPESYHHFIRFVIQDHAPAGHLHAEVAGHGQRTLTPHHPINDVLVAFFFAVVGKDVREAITRRDASLKGTRTMTPLIATVGGMAGPGDMQDAVRLGALLGFGAAAVAMVLRRLLRVQKQP